jgi:cobalamin biosynthesis Mg chelatase CobN
MAKENTPAQKQVQRQPQPAARNSAAPSPNASRKKKGQRANRSQVGGTAVTGARSTQPRQVGESSNPQQQQYDSYNRTMRRRMSQIGTAPDEENKVQSAQEKRKKRIERRKQQLDTRRAELRRQMPTFGRRNLYFFLGTLAVVVILIIVFLVLRANHLIGG